MKSVNVDAFEADTGKSSGRESVLLSAGILRVERLATAAVRGGRAGGLICESVVIGIDTEVVTDCVSMGRCCGSCKWCDFFSSVCLNPDGYWYLQLVTAHDRCEHWEGY